MAGITQTAKQVIAQLKKSRGNISHAANALDVARQTLYTYLNEHPTVKEAHRDIKEANKDRAETMLESRMATSDTLLIFYLKTQAHDRGYGDRSQVEHSGGILVNMDK
jgi:hypothetical protein